MIRMGEVEPLDPGLRFAAAGLAQAGRLCHLVTYH